ncbi:hypothetical protein ACJZ2D_003049 [Fusarium nematophilum]
MSQPTATPELMQGVEADSQPPLITAVENSDNPETNTTAADAVRFPGRNQQEATKFGAAKSAIIWTHIFYQHQDLFESQRQVDDLVDDIAFNLGVSRGDLNIVATSKGIIAGPLTIHLTDGSSPDPCSGDLGVAIPITQAISSVELNNVKWIIVVEKDAIFRSLSSSKFWETSLFGPGVLITAKGYPDLTTRAFLNYIHTRHPQLPILALVDYDPDGIRILRCYRYGSERLGHEADLDTQDIQWLGIKSTQLVQESTAAGASGPDVNNQGSQSSTATLPSQVSITSTSCRDPVSYLSLRERGVAVSTLQKLAATRSIGVEAMEIRRELQVMIALGVKAEIEWLDESGDLCRWLDCEIGKALLGSLQ